MSTSKDAAAVGGANAPPVALNQAPIAQPQPNINQAPVGQPNPNQAPAGQPNANQAQPNANQPPQVVPQHLIAAAQFLAQFHPLAQFQPLAQALEDLFGHIH